MRIVGVLFWCVMLCIGSQGARAADDWVGDMLRASTGADEARIHELKSHIEQFPKPERGDRKAARLLNETGLRQLGENDFAAAVDTLALASASDPSDVEILNNRAFALIRSNRFAEAKPVLESLLLLAPGRSGAWFNLGETYAGLGDDEKAIAAFRLALIFSKNQDKTREFLTKIIENKASSTVLVSSAKNVMQTEAKPLAPVGASSAQEGDRQPAPDTVAEEKPDAQSQLLQAEGKQEGTDQSATPLKEQPALESVVAKPAGKNDSTNDKWVIYLLGGAVTALILLLIAGMQGNVVIFYDWKDFRTTLAVFVSGLLGVLMAVSSDDDMTRMVTGAVTGLVVLYFCIQTIRSSVIHNRSLALGLAVGMVKVLVAVFSVFFVLGKLQDIFGKSESMGARIVAATVLGLFAWFLHMLVNGERVYAKKGWPLAGQGA